MQKRYTAPNAVVSWVGGLLFGLPCKSERSIPLDGPPESHRDFEQAGQFAKLLNHLFATRPAPSGRPYTLTEVSKATGLSVPYLSILRKGTISAVPLQRAAALARFFKVSLDYFSQEGEPVDNMNDLVRDAISKPLVLEVTLRAGRIGTAQRALILQMMDHAEQVLQEIDSPSAPLPPSADTPSEQKSEP